MQEFNIDRQIQQQQEQSVDFEKKQVKTMELHARRNKDAGDILYERAQQREAEGDEKGSINAYSEAGHNYMKSSEKITKAAVVANNKEDSTFERTYNNNGKEKKVKKKVIKEHSVEKANEALGPNALTSSETADKIDKITGNDANSYIELQYGDKNNEPVSLSKEEATFLKEANEEILENYNKQKDIAKEKKKQQNLVDFIDGYLDDSLGYSKY